jgi:hypothetical protein
MDAAVRWVEEHSETRRSTRVILRYIAEQAEGCISMVSVGQLANKAGVSRATVFRSLAEAASLREVQRIEGVSFQSVGCFHLEKWCLTFFRLGSDSAKKTCRQVVGFRERYRGCRNLPLLRGTQLRLLPEPMAEWAPMITDAELRWRSDELKQRLGIPVRREEFRLRMPA